MLATHFAEIRPIRSGIPDRFAHSAQSIDAFQNYIRHMTRLIGMPRTIMTAQRMGHMSPLVQSMADNVLHIGHPFDVGGLHDFLTEYPGLHTKGGTALTQGYDPVHPIQHLANQAAWLRMQDQLMQDSPHHIAHFMGTQHLNESGIPELIHRHFGVHPLSMRNVPAMYDAGILPEHALNFTMEHALNNARSAREVAQLRSQIEAFGQSQAHRKQPTMLHFADLHGIQH